MDLAALWQFSEGIFINEMDLSIAIRLIKTTGIDQNHTLFYWSFKHFCLM